MLVLGQKVLVKECQPDNTYNSIIYSDNHGNYKSVTGTIIKIIGKDKDKCILDFDTDMIFGEDMLDVIDNNDLVAPAVIDRVSVKVSNHTTPKKIGDPIDQTSNQSNRDLVILELEKHREILKAISDPELFFKLYHDKLKSLLFEIYGG